MHVTLHILHAMCGIREVAINVHGPYLCSGSSMASNFELDPHIQNNITAGITSDDWCVCVCVCVACVYVCDEQPIS